MITTLVDRSELLRVTSTVASTYGCKNLSEINYDKVTQIVNMHVILANGSETKPLKGQINKKKS